MISQEAFFTLTGLTKVYDTNPVVDSLNLSVGQGELIALLGQSGCGKTTTLRMVAGFVAPTGGSIQVAGRDITRLPPDKRNMGMMFQSYALFPHMTVWKNIDFGLNLRRVPIASRKDQIASVLEMVGLSAYANRYPKELSGGQQQRVALARVLVLKPDLLLLDEPLSNLDTKLRFRMRHEIRSLQRKLGITALLVTHDQEEAMTMADRIVVMNRGKVEQIGTPKDIYDRPQTSFVADFIGRSNLLRGTIRVAGSAGVFHGKNGLCLPVGDRSGPNGAVVLSIRPEQIEFMPSSSTAGVEATVRESVLMGPVAEYLVELRSGETLRVQEHREWERGLRDPGQDVRVDWHPEAAVVLPAADGAEAGEW